MGVSIGWFLGGDVPAVSQASTAAVAPRGGLSTAPAAPARPGLSAPAASPSTDRAIVTASIASAAIDEAQVVSTAKAAIPTPPLAQSAGAGRLGGRVLDYLDRPVAGVQVAIEPARHGRQEARSLGSLGGLGGGNSLEEEVLESARQWAGGGGLRRLAETDASGAFEFSGLPDGSWSIEAGLEGWRVDRVSSRPRSVPTGAMVDFEAVPRVPVTIDVLGLGGEPLEEATLELHVGSGRATHYAWTRSMPELNLSPGRYRVRAISTPQPGSVDNGKWRSEAASEEVELGVLVGDPQHTEVLQLVPRTGVFGHVQLPREPLEGNSLGVRLVKLEEGVEPELSSFRRSGEHMDLDDDSTFGFMDLEPGRYGVGFVDSRRADALAMETVEVLQGELVEVELVVEAPEPKRTLTAVVLDSNGDRLQDVSFQMQRKTTERSSSGSLGTERLPEGGYELTLDEDEEGGYWEHDGSGAQFFLTATSASQGKRRIEVRAGLEFVEIQLEAAAELEVRIMGYDAARYAGRVSLSLSEVSEDGSSTSFRGTRNSLDAGGVQLFENMGPGKKRLYLYLQRSGGGWGRGGGPVATLDVVAEPGFNRASIALPALAQLRVRAPDLRNNNRMELRPVGGGNSYSEALGEDLIAVFEDIPHGEYILSCRGIAGTMDVAVPGGEVLWKPRAASGMRIEEMTPEHPLRTAGGLAVGDVLLEINGDAVEQNTLWSRLYALSVDPSSTAAILYLRDSQRRTAELRGSEIDQGSLGQGIRLQPVYD